MNKKLYVFITMALLGIFLLAIPALAQDDVEDKFADEQGGGVAPAPTGGPDTYGHMWYDQSTGECDYQFIDISTSGTLAVSGDDASGAISLGGNDISFYGVDYSDLFMNSNGFLTTTAGSDLDVSNDCPLPATPSTGSGARIYAVHDDLITTSGLYEWIDPCPRPADMWDHSGGNSPGCHVFMFDEVTHFGASALFNLEIIIYGTTNEIVILTPDGIDENGAGATTGIQDEAASDGLTYACNDGTTFPAGQDTAVCIFEPSAPTAVSLTNFGGDAAGSLFWTAIAVALLSTAAFGVFLTLRSKQKA